jgi:nucleoside-diphosphate-sugar epimerase
MAKALITGGLGFIGLHLSKRLLADGFEVHAFDNCQRGTIDPEVERLRADGRYRLILGDLMDPRVHEDLDSDYDYIYHMAAIVGVRNVIGDPYSVLRDNVLSLLSILSFAKTQRNLDRFLFPSTSEVYAGTLQYFGMEIPTPESTPLTVTDVGQPRTSYMLSKIYGEALCQKAGVPFTIIRPHNVYGPRMGMAHVVPELLERAHRTPAGGKLLVFSPSHKRAFCYVDDAIELIVGVVGSPAGLNGTFNIGSTADETTIAALAQLIVAMVGRPLEVESGPETPGSPRRRQPDVTSAMSVASYRPRIPLEEGVRRTYDWYRTEMFEATQPLRRTAAPTAIPTAATSLGSLKA